jgi:hypothetical protein
MIACYSQTFCDQRKHSIRFAKADLTVMVCPLVTVKIDWSFHENKKNSLKLEFPAMLENRELWCARAHVMLPHTVATLSGRF